MRIIFLISLMYLSMSFTQAQMVFKLWEGNPPTDNGLNDEKTIDGGKIADVAVPDITLYLPEKDINKKMGVVICPGGGYTSLAIDHEGHAFARWLQSQGIAGIVLKYRMPNKHKEVPLEDFQQAMRFVRSKAVEWNLVDSDMNSKIGVAGFSAGGHLAATGSTHYDNNELRPDFSILFYPVITMGQYSHEGTRRNLLGDNRMAEDVLYYSNETSIDKQTPSAILLLSDDDNSVSSINSIMYYEQLKKNNIPATMYIFPDGGHGWGMHDTFKYHNEMLSLLKSWLEELYPEK